MSELIIGVDIGYGNTKTAHSCMGSGVSKLVSKPPISTRVIEWNGGYYSVGGQKMTIQQSKVQDENTLVLTLAAIAEEMKRVNTTSACVHLGVGVPLTRMGMEKDEMQAYYMRNRHYTFRYEEKTYSIVLNSVSVFPQGYAGIAHMLGELPKSSLIIDIGSWTVDLLPIIEKCPVLEKCKSLNMGTIPAMNDINEDLRQSVGGEADVITLIEVMSNGKSEISPKYLECIRNGIHRYLDGLMDQIRAFGFNPDITKFVFVGGGASIVKNFLDLDNYPRALVIDDVNINAKGYEQLLRRKFQGGGK